VVIAVLFFFMGVTWTVANWKNDNDQSIATNTKDILTLQTKLDEVNHKMDQEINSQIAIVDKLDQISVFLGMPGVKQNLVGTSKVSPVTQK
jgi:hypothetical protein